MNYQFTKSIGFRLDGDNQKQLIPSVIGKDRFQIFLDCNSQYKILIETFENAVFFKTREGEKKVKKKLEIKYPWLKQHAKTDFYDQELNKKKTKIFTIENARFLQKTFEEWLNRNKEQQEEIEKIVNQPQNDKKRESDLALLLKTVFGTDYFFFVRDFVQYAKDKDSDADMKKLQKSVEIFQTLLEQSLHFLSPNQTTGMEVTRASFNFYTIDKSSKNVNGKTTEEIVEEKKAEQQKPYQKFLLDKAFLQKIGFEEYLKNWEGKEGEKYSATTAQELSFQELYSALKDFRAKQKSAFNEAIYQEKWKEVEIEKVEEKVQSKGKADLSKIEKNKAYSLADFFAQAGVERKAIKQKSPQEIDEEKKKQIKKFVQENFPLFDISDTKDKKGEDVLWDFVKLTEEIQGLGNEKNQATGFEVSKIAKKLKEKREKRGKYFIENWGFSLYSKKYCNEMYKKVAMDFGKLKAEIRGMEQEKIEARLLNFWAMILEEKNEKFLVLIPKDKRREAKNFLDAKPNGKGEKTICVFNSLTLRALDKMIRKNYPKEISEKAGSIPFETDIQKIECYKNALLGKLQKLDLDLSGFKNKIPEIIQRKDSNEEKTLEDFRMDFEKISYVVQKKNVSGDDISKLKNDCGAIISKVSCYDLERKLTGEKREHTSYWDNFWNTENEKENFSVRLNPELRIFYRNALEQFDENGEIDAKKQKNRFSKDHFRVSFTLTQNAAQKELQTTFADEKDLREKIKKFNEEVIGNFMQKSGENLWYFGIDRGNQELATLGVVKWTQEEYEATLKSGEVKKFPKPEFPEIEVWEIKNPNATKEKTNDAKGTKIIVKIADNPSFFMENEEEIEKYFSKKNVAFIDLTTAKLIKGKIILDGDTKTYLNLKKANAKRKLFDVFLKIHESKNVEFFENQFRILKSTETNRRHQTLCYFLPQQEKILPKAEMQTILQEYLNALRKDATFQEITIEQINHLRDAITANMVGIIAFLHEQYPAIINLENLLKEGEIAKHFSNNNENIARRLEWALYRKFQKIGLVPPNLKQTIFLKEKTKKEERDILHHFGIIHFIPTENTSGNCPFCGENVTMKQRKEVKFEEHTYICGNDPSCRFTTKNPKNPLGKIDNSDSVASYNIAKRGFELIPKTP